MSHEEQHARRLSISLQLKIDEACDQFEREWSQGRSPRIEDYLESVSSSVRMSLLRELLLLELELRSRVGQVIYRQSLEERFPDYQRVVREIFPRPTAITVQENLSTNDDRAASTTDLFATQLEDQSTVHSPKLAGVHQLIGPYRMVERVGQGGMGTVYRGTHVADQSGCRNQSAAVGNRSESTSRYAIPSGGADVRGSPTPKYSYDL